MISFIVISGGSRPASLARLFKSIEVQKIPEYEIVIVGNHNISLPENGVYVERPDLADSAAICEMRNIGMERARGETMILLDDDVEFLADWYAKLKPHLDEKFDIASCRVLTPTGERWYDWAYASREDVACPTKKLDYSETGNSIYIGGCFMMIRRHVFEKTKFNEDLKNHQRDDVEFCHRAWDDGFKLSIFPSATVIHHLDPAGRSEADPSAGGDRLSYGIYLYRMAKYEKAIEIFKQTEAESFVKSAYHMALCNMKLGENGKALKKLKEVIVLSDTTDTDNRRIFYNAHFHLGVLNESDGNFLEAEKMYSKTVEGFKDHFEASAGLLRVTERLSEK